LRSGPARPAQRYSAIRAAQRNDHDPSAPKLVAQANLAVSLARPRSGAPNLNPFRRKPQVQRTFSHSTTLHSVGKATAQIFIDT